MKNSKITKILPLALALSLSIGCVQAAIDGQDETGNDKAQVQYSLTLNDYVKITQSGGVTTSDGNYSNDYAALNLTNALSANFKVITNAKRTVELSSPSYATDTPSALYGYKPADHSFHLVFVNTEAGGVPSTSVTKITGAEAGSAVLAESPNAFAFKFTAPKVKATYDRGDSADAGTITGQFANGKITFTLPNGVSELNFASETTAMSDTFNTRDTKGTYKADLILTDKGAVQAAL